jgi:hypothetical protein
MQHLIIGKLLVIFMLLQNLSFAQISVDETSCSYFQDDLHLMNSLTNYCNTKINSFSDGFIVVSVFQCRGSLVYYLGHAESICQDIVSMKFDSFKFGDYYVLVFSGFEHPTLQSVYDKKRKLLPHNLMNNESEFTEIRLKYKYNFFQYVEMPFKVEKYKLEGFPIPFPIYYPFVEFKNNFVNPFKK